MGNWYNYTEQGEIIEIVIKDYSNRKIESFRWKMGDKKREFIIGKILKEKYGVTFIPEKKKSDMDWVKKT